MRILQGLLPGQVLQRTSKGARADIFGLCSASGAVLATVRENSIASPIVDALPIGRADGRSFCAKLCGLPAGGPYSITIECEREKLDIHDVLVGDLWLMAGQSNMEGNGMRPTATLPHPLVRCFTMARRWETASDPLHRKAESPDPVHRNNPGGAGVGVGVAFGRMMLEQTGVPQGLIATAHGGTTMKQWSPALKHLGGNSLYGSMLLSVRTTGQPLAGVLWYQGESEALPELARLYTARMRRLVDAVRRDLSQPRLPWLMAQLGRFVKAEPKDEWPDPASWNWVQEQQRRLPTLISNTAVVPAIDLPLDDQVHLGTDAFPILAQRFADVANSFLCGRKVSAARPGIALSISGAERRLRITVEFSGLSGDLRNVGPVCGFSLTDSSGRSFDAIYRAMIQRNCVILYIAGTLPEGCRISYGRGLNPVCALTDESGMAVPVFGPLDLPVSRMVVGGPSMPRKRATLSPAATGTSL